MASSSGHDTGPAGPAEPAGPAGPAAEHAEQVEQEGPTLPVEPEPRVLCDARELAADPPIPGGVLWKLAEAGRQLDANLVRIAPGGRVAPHAEPDLDVLLLVVSGGGVLGAGTADEPRPLAEGATVWLPHGSTRSITAGTDGLTYLTVHRRRPGMWIRPHGTVS